MSISLTCYSVMTVSDLQSKLDAISKKYSDLFLTNYVLYRAKEPDDIQKEISTENGLEANSVFRIGLIDKSLKISTASVANMLREELGKDSVIVLFNGESVI